MTRGYRGYPEPHCAAESVPVRARAQAPRVLVSPLRPGRFIGHVMDLHLTMEGKLRRGGDTMRDDDSHLQYELGRHLRQEWLADRMPRREFLRSATVLGLSAATIAGLVEGTG